MARPLTDSLCSRVSSAVLVVQTAAAVVTGREGSSVTLAVEITAGVAERTVEVLVTVLNGSGSATGTCTSVLCWRGT